MFVLCKSPVLFSATRMRRGFNWSLVPIAISSRTEVVAYQNPPPPVPQFLFPSTRTQIRRFTMTNSLNNARDPVNRTASPYQSPNHIGPKSKLLSSHPGSKLNNKKVKTWGGDNIPSWCNCYYYYSYFFLLSPSLSTYRPTYHPSIYLPSYQPPTNHTKLTTPSS